MVRASRIMRSRDCYVLRGDKVRSLELLALPSEILRLSAHRFRSRLCGEREETLATQKREERFLLLLCPTTVTQ